MMHNILPYLATQRRGCTKTAVVQAEQGSVVRRRLQGMSRSILSIQVLDGIGICELFLVGKFHIPKA